MKCIVIDDDEFSRNCLSQLIKQVDFISLSETFSDPLNALNYLASEQIDLIFLDVEMPGLTGLEFIKNLKKAPAVVLVTGKKDYAVEAFEHHVVDYLVKPVAFPRFYQSVVRAKEHAEKNTVQTQAHDQEHIFIKNKMVWTKVSTADILWVEALGDYMVVHTKEKSHTLHTTMKDIESKLPAGKFLRVHRSYIVGVDHIASIEDNTIIIGKKFIPIGANYNDGLRRRLNLV